MVLIKDLDMTVNFDRDETIHTENSYKFSDEQITTLASQSGLNIKGIWKDERAWFSVVLMSPL
jgi:uncharacterized SAM-dependent methyltransferase